MAADPISDEVNVLLGNGDGSFRPAVPFPAGDRPTEVAVADLDGDGAQDLAVSNSAAPLFPPGVTVRQGNGDGSFGPETFFPVTGPGPRWLAVVDLDGDGVPDLVTVNSFGEDVSVLLGNGDGSFEAAVSYPVGSQPNSIAVADFDGNGAADVAVVAFNSGVGFRVNLLLGNGDGSLQAPLLVEAGPGALAAGDLDGDGVADLVATGSRNSGGLLDGEVNALLGNGDGSFQPAVGFPVEARGLAAVVVTDLDGDGAPDVVTGNSTDDVAVLLGNGDGSFGPAALYGVGLDPFRIAVADLDADRLPDVATADSRSRTVTVLLQLPDSLLRPEIDIRPGRKLPLVQPGSRRPLPVALLGAEDFEVLEVDVDTLAFGPEGATPLRFACKRRDVRRAKGDDDDEGDDEDDDCRATPFLEDVDRDGFLDLVSHYRSDETGLVTGDREACLAGALLDGTPFEGCGAVVTLPRCGLGFEVALLLPGLAWLRRRRGRLPAGRQEPARRSRAGCAASHRPAKSGD
ncbi:MAG: VCBS repeat-containing protein [Myxococcota bacterium]|nr:VCBS repeat-containing protein [Myxococcota bacterium]